MIPALPAAARPSPQNIQSIRIGRYEVECWYFSPYPREMYLNDVTETVRLGEAVVVTHQVKRCMEKVRVPMERRWCMGV